MKEVKVGYNGLGKPRKVRVRSGPIVKACNTVGSLRILQTANTQTFVTSNTRHAVKSSIVPLFVLLGSISSFKLILLIYVPMLPHCLENLIPMSVYLLLFLATKMCSET